MSEICDCRFAICDWMEVIAALVFQLQIANRKSQMENWGKEAKHD